MPNVQSHCQPSLEGQSFPCPAEMMAVVSLDQLRGLPEGSSLASWPSTAANSPLRAGDTGLALGFAPRKVSSPVARRRGLCISEDVGRALEFSLFHFPLQGRELQGSVRLCGSEDL